MAKGFDELKNFSFERVVNELKEKLPLFMQMLCAISISPSSCTSQRINELIPRWALVYGIVMQANFAELSYVQHFLSAIMEESLCDQKVSMLKNLLIKVVE